MPARRIRRAIVCWPRGSRNRRSCHMVSIRFGSVVTTPLIVLIVPPVGRRPSRSVRALASEQCRQGLGCRFGVDPAARAQFDPTVTPEERPSLQPWAQARIKSMTATEIELAKPSVNCMPRGVSSIWLRNPYSTLIIHTPKMMTHLYEVLNNWRSSTWTDARFPGTRNRFLWQQYCPPGGRHAGRRVDRTTS
jgi:hypothetical protein